ncbi:MAG: acyl-CoA/acyl-ACP dehydrogenase [Betaproteobacteria bacterium]|nr:acyl-CoA/acyl-ACP dehydrogenase [Betaproteobacteria bacterium]MBT7997365.1 acyl-CoA/acyl-ACP dehydrogenase [Betaproteobacteria bacterium]
MSYSSLPSGVEKTPAREQIVASVQTVCDRFDDDFWLEKDQKKEFPFEFHRAMSESGWLGITMPVEFGGAGLGVTEAALMMHTVGRSAGAFAACSSIHINLFGPHAIIKYGTPEQKSKWIPRLITGEDKVAFGVTEPDVGLDTTRIKTRAVRRGSHYEISGSKVWMSTAQIANKILLVTRTSPIEDCAKGTDGITLFYVDIDPKYVEVREIDKMGRAAVDSNLVFIDGLVVSESDRVGEEGDGFRMLLDTLNPERILIAAEAIGVGRRALDKAVNYANEREVFGRLIGQNQAIQHPLAESWMALEAADLMVWRAAGLYDDEEPCGAEANAAKFLAADAAYEACDRAVRTHGGFGYAKEYHVERYLREIMIPRIAPVSRELIMCYIAERVLGLPRSY